MFDSQAPVWCDLLMLASALLALALLTRAAGGARWWTVAILSWLVVQAAIGSTEFYLREYALPPRFALALLPPILFILVVFATRKGRVFSDGLDLRLLTLMHVVRIPIELMLHGLQQHGMVPTIMTYEGRNFDIFSGITAPIMAWYAFRDGHVNRPLLLVWNVLCLALVLNVLFYGLLSVPTPLQRFGFDEPNVGVLVTPFVWLPAFVVPVVIYAHLVVLRRLMKRTAR